MNRWGWLAKEHWETHLPERYAQLVDPESYFTQLGEEASDRYQAIRDGLLAGVSPNDGTIGWAEFQDRVARADQQARETVETEMIYLPPETPSP